MPGGFGFATSIFGFGWLEIAFSGLVGYTCVFAVSSATFKLLLIIPE